MALYKVHLATGHTVRGLDIKANTIGNYLAAVAFMFKQIKVFDSRYKGVIIKALKHTHS